MHDQPTPNTVAHFAINADDIDRAARFYGEVFGWRFEPWGPPGFLMIVGAGVNGSLQGRRTLVDGARTVGYECTIAVDDLHAAVQRAVRAGATVLMEPVTIPTVGDLAYIADPEGNAVGMMRYAER